MTRRGLVLGLASGLALGFAAVPDPIAPRAPAAEVGSTPAPLAPPPPAPRVVIVSEDGMRVDALVPVLAPRHRAFAAEGARALVAETVEPSETLPAHTSMLTGMLPAGHGMVWDGYLPRRGLVAVPTIFTIAHDAGRSTAMFAGKRKLSHLALGLDTFEVPGHLCDGVVDRAIAYFTAYRPEVMFVHFADPDDAGHAKGWMTPAYLAAVRAADRCLARLLAAIDATEVAAATVVIVTADHGGNARTHWDTRDPVVRRIPWMIRGPGVPPGAVITARVSTVDTAATALAVLGLPAPPGMIGVARYPIAAR